MDRKIKFLAHFQKIFASLHTNIQSMQVGRILPTCIFIWSYQLKKTNAGKTKSERKEERNKTLDKWQFARTRTL